MPGARKRKRTGAAQPTVRRQKHRKRRCSCHGLEFYVTDNSANDRSKRALQQSPNQILESVTTSSCDLANEFLAKCHEATKNNPVLSETLAKFVDQLRDGETSFYSTRQPGVRLEIPLHPIVKLEEMFCLVEDVRAKFLPTVALMRNQCLDTMDPNTDFSTQEQDQILSEWQEDYEQWMPAASMKRYKELLQETKKGTDQQARHLLRTAHEKYQMHVVGSTENIKLLQHLIQYPSQTAPARWMKTQVLLPPPKPVMYELIPFGRLGAQAHANRNRPEGARRTQQIQPF